ncbi:MAG: enoyl-CoA hydratase-related protein [Sphingopyxis sp.]
MSEADASLTSERRTEHVLLLRLNRPEKRNALATDLLGRIADALDGAAADPAVRAVIVTGNEKVFAAGADIGELVESAAQAAEEMGAAIREVEFQVRRVRTEIVEAASASRDTAGAMNDPRPAIWARIRGFPKPLIAAVEGWSLGAGNELVMCCDLVVSGASAKFGQPETNLGIIPGAGGTATLPRLVGRGRAMKMVLLGEALTAAEALHAGLVTDVVGDGNAVAAALELAEKIAARAPLAMQQGKALVRAGLETHQTAHLAMERQAFAGLFGTADKVEGVTAFLEKRPANWQGR